MICPLYVKLVGSTAKLPGVGNSYSYGTFHLRERKQQGVGRSSDRHHDRTDKGKRVTYRNLYFINRKLNNYDTLVLETAFDRLMIIRKLEIDEKTHLILLHLTTENKNKVELNGNAGVILYSSCQQIP